MSQVIMIEISLFVRPTNNLGLTIYSIIAWTSINIVVVRLSHHIQKYVRMITTVRLKRMYMELSTIKLIFCSAFNEKDAFKLISNSIQPKKGNQFLSTILIMIPFECLIFNWPMFFEHCTLNWNVAYICFIRYQW